MKKYKIGDELLVYNQYHLEKSRVEKITKRGTLLLSNQLEVESPTLNVLNSKSKFTVEPFDQDKYDYLFAKSMMEKKIFFISSKYSSLKPESMVKLYNGLDKLINKCF